MRMFSTMFHRNFFLVVLIVAIATIILLYLLADFFGLSTPKELTLAAYTGIPLFIITLLQLERTLRQQRANFVKDYISQFFLNRELLSSFHNLIKEFTRDRWKEVQKLVERNKKDLDAEKQNIWDILSNLNTTKKEGNRLYHPDYFQGSDEELNLDGVLGYFDVIGYHYHRHLVPLEDVVATVGFYLRAINSNYAVKHYLETIRKTWEEKDDFKEAYGLLHTFYYLDKLLVAIEDYDKKNEDKLRKMAEEIKAK